MRNLSHTSKKGILRKLGIGGLAAIASLVLAGRVHATYFHSGGAYAPAYADCYSAGDYIDRGWYYLLDDGQYHYITTSTGDSIICSEA